MDRLNLKLVGGTFLLRHRPHAECCGRPLPFSSDLLRSSRSPFCPRFEQNVENIFLASLSTHAANNLKSFLVSESVLDVFLFFFRCFRFGLYGSASFGGGFVRGVTAEQQVDVHEMSFELSAEKDLIDAAKIGQSKYHLEAPAP